ncbi:unnamed protein product, partial [Eruca vesicaria subsp. sativa]|nr:unnamed protein product [Eruca vesicaria subsp. sativa]
MKARNAPIANIEKMKLVREEEACMKKNCPKEKTSAPCGDDTFRHDLMEMMNTLTTKIRSMDTVIVEKVLTAVDTTIDAKVDARVCQAELVLNKKISDLEEMIDKLRHQRQATAPKNNANFVNQEDEVNNNDPLVQDKTPSPLDAASQCVVRKKGKNNEFKQDIERSFSPILLEREGEKVVEEKKVKRRLEDSSATWSNPEDKERYGELGATLDELAASLLDGPLQKCKPQLTKTQVFPYVISSTVKRIITHDDDSKAHYDPLDNVDETKLKKLLDFLEIIRKKDGYDGTSSSESLFYKRPITPIDKWETYNYGCLTNS